MKTPALSFKNFLAGGVEDFKPIIDPSHSHSGCAEM